MIALAETGLRLDHVGIAVRDIVAARGFYEGLGMVSSELEEIAGEGVRVAMLASASGRIELLEPMSEHGAIARFLVKHGEGMHHMAIRVADVEGEFQRMKRDGLRLAADHLQIGAGGHRYFFVHPASAGGVLVEIVGA